MKRSISLFDDRSRLLRLKRKIAFSTFLPEAGRKSFPNRRCLDFMKNYDSDLKDVIKPFGKNLRNIPGVSGGAISRDGKVGLILDIPGISGISKQEYHGMILP